MAERIQLRRTKGWRMPANTVKVTRPSRWGNPFVVGTPDPRRGGIPYEPSSVVERFTDALVRGELPISEADVRRELAGKNLACWCPIGSPCHAEVLLCLAAEPAAIAKASPSPSKGESE